jgi:glycosyltransferase involved in cell wall biosynthesis
MKILLVLNYPADAQQSMLRFGQLLQEQLGARGHEVRTIAPVPGALRGRLAHRGALGKWAGYLDKYLAFPSALRDALAREATDLVHVVDHSNAVYLPARRERPWVVTCHDLLAVRGALGEDTDCPASWLGARLQRAVVRGLVRADAIVCDSQSTASDAERLVPRPATQLRRVVPLALNQPLRPLARPAARVQLARLDLRLAQSAFLLHVGSNLPRKNKAAVVRIFARARAAGWNGRLVFCGAPWSREVANAAQEAGCTDELTILPHVSPAELAALYSAAHALVFPSKCEGFGWPVLEAQACGCPVICSDRTSLPEVGGEAALVLPLEDEAGMAAAVVALTNAQLRAERSRRGRAQAARFSVERMIDGYREVYEEVLARRPT